MLFGGEGGIVHVIGRFCRRHRELDPGSLFRGESGVPTIRHHSSGPSLRLHDVASFVFSFASVINMGRGARGQWEVPTHPLHPATKRIVILCVLWCVTDAYCM